MSPAVSPSVLRARYLLCWYFYAYTYIYTRIYTYPYAVGCESLIDYAAEENYTKELAFPNQTYISDNCHPPQEDQNRSWDLSQITTF